MLVFENLPLKIIKQTISKIIAGKVQISKTKGSSANISRLVPLVFILNCSIITHIVNIK